VGEIVVDKGVFCLLISRSVPETSTIEELSEIAPNFARFPSQILDVRPP